MVLLESREWVLDRPAAPASELLFHRLGWNALITSNSSSGFLHYLAQLVRSPDTVIVPHARITCC